MAQDFLANQTVAMQNQSNCKITFDNQLKTALFCYRFTTYLGTSVVKVVEMTKQNQAYSRLLKCFVIP